MYCCNSAASRPMESRPNMLVPERERAAARAETNVLWKYCQKDSQRCLSITLFDDSCIKLHALTSSCSSCRMLQRVAACCSMLQRVAACCKTLQHVAACCSMLQHVAACCSVLQHVAARCSMLQHGIAHWMLSGKVSLTYHETSVCAACVY